MADGEAGLAFAFLLPTVARMARRHSGPLCALSRRACPRAALECLSHLVSDCSARRGVITTAQGWCRKEGEENAASKPLSDRRRSFSHVAGSRPVAS